MAPSTKDFLLISSTGVLHAVPTQEQCNADQVPRHRRLRFATQAEAKAHPRYRRTCRYCRVRIMENPDPAAGPEHGFGAILPDDEE